MRLQPKAKPIRIRIKLGQNECSSLDEVKNNFSIKDLYPMFKDHRLDRWLTQIGECSRAERAKRMVSESIEDSKDDSIQDYIKFLSLFFDDIDQEWTVDEFVNCAPVRICGYLYRDAKESPCIDWPYIIRHSLTIERAERLFLNKDLYSLFDGSWGSIFAELVHNDDDYKKVFKFLAGSAPDAADIRSILKEFHSVTSGEYKWEDVFKDSLNLDFISDTLKNGNCRDMAIDWGAIIAEILKDWDSEIEMAKSILADFPDLQQSFYQRCLKRGFSKASEMMINPWHALSEDKEEMKIIQFAINNWDGRNYDKYACHYNSLKSDLAKQILDFLQSLIDMREENGHWTPSTYEQSGCYYLKDEKEIMISVKNRYTSNNNSKYLFDSHNDRSRLEQMCNEGVELAGYVLRHGTDSYLEIAVYVVREYFPYRLRGNIPINPQTEKAVGKKSKKTSRLSKESKEAIKDFLEAPSRYVHCPDDPELEKFLQNLTSVWILSKKDSKLSTKENKNNQNLILQTFAKLSDSKYSAEAKYLNAMFSYYLDNNKITAKRYLGKIYEEYKPAAYMWHYFATDVPKNDIVSTHIEKYNDIHKHIKLVVEHLDGTPFA